MFGVTTNSLLKNIGWAKKGILSFSTVPLNVLSFAGIILLAMTVVLMVTQFLAKLFFPEKAAPGITTTLLAIMFYGSLSVFGIGVLAEYVAKIIEEVKRRPLYIRRSVIRDGETRPAADLPDAGAEGRR
jgi:dolichol-phosphate mannosyltransferase